MADFRSSPSRVLREAVVDLPLTLAALGFLALAPGRGALVVLAAAGLGKDAGLLDLLVEAAEGGLERLTVADDHFGHPVHHPPFRLNGARAATAKPRGPNA